MDLTQEFERAKTAYEIRFAEAMAKRKQEVWTSGHYYNIDPFDFQRRGFQQGKILTKPPKVTKNKFCYLLDSAANVIMAKQGLSIPDQYNEEFVYIEDEINKSCLYQNDKALINIKVRLFENEKLSQVHLKGTYGSKHESYFYENDRLNHIRIRQWEDAKDGVSYNVMFYYDLGVVSEIVNEFDNGYSEVRYKRK